MLCKVSGCTRRVHCKGACQPHYRQLRKYDPSLPECAGLNCDVRAKVAGFCDSCYARLRRCGNPDYVPSVQEWTTTKAGYVRKRNLDGRPGEVMLQHRVVMEAMLGRSLESFENVHHKNGIRSDNRPENLELWVKPQPAGQRPEDLAQWVVEHYPDLVSRALGKGVSR